MNGGRSSSKYTVSVNIWYRTVTRLPSSPVVDVAPSFFHSQLPPEKRKSLDAKVNSGWSTYSVTIPAIAFDSVTINSFGRCKCFGEMQIGRESIKKTMTRLSFRFVTVSKNLCLYLQRSSHIVVVSLSFSFAHTDIHTGGIWNTEINRRAHTKITQESC